MDPPRPEPPRPQPRHARHAASRCARSDELKIHVQIARNNGLTEDEIAEVIYHSSGYAGLPAANSACKLAREVFDAPQPERGTQHLLGGEHWLLQTLLDEVVPWLRRF